MLNNLVSNMKAIITPIIFTIILFACNKPEKPMADNQQKKDSTAFRSGYEEVNGINMYYEAYGNSGDYLVLVHGGGSTIGTSFSAVIPTLSKTHRIIAVELQAHGHTSDRDAPESFEQDADDVATLLQKLKIPRASFFGFSNGGNTVMQISLRHPEVVEKLIIASAFYKREGMPPGFFEGMEHATLEHMPADLQKAFLDITPDSTKLLNMFNKDRNRMLNFKDWKDETIASIKAPALVINGDQDVASNIHIAKMASLIPNSRLMILPGNHGSYMGQVENPDPEDNTLKLTLAVIEDFLKTNP